MPRPDLSKIGSREAVVAEQPTRTLEDAGLPPVKRDVGAAALRTLFARFNSRYGKPAEEWAISNIPRHLGDGGTVFYPFGGPDLLFPLSLFPRVRDYVLVGAEHPGPSSPESDLDDAVLVAIADTMRHYLEESFFVTKDLRAQLSSNGLGGVARLLLVQIMQAGLPVHRIASIGSPRTGIRIEFGSRVTPSSLHYFQQDLRDHLWSANCPLSRHLDSKKGIATLIKSASYLLHERQFERLRHLVRSRTSLLVQDPSGIPYRLLREWNWNVDLHGRFVGDLPVFSKYQQPELMAAYENVSTTLPFGVGYLNDPARASLMVATPRPVRRMS